MTGTQEYRRLTPSDCGESLGEGIKGYERPFRIDHIAPRSALRIGRDPALVGHQPDQIPLPPGPLRIKSDQHPRIPSGKEPITPQTLLPRGGHRPSKPSSQQMGPQGPNTQHTNDAAGLPSPPPRKPQKHPTVGATGHDPSAPIASGGQEAPRVQPRPCFPRTHPFTANSSAGAGVFQPVRRLRTRPFRPKGGLGAQPPGTGWDG